MPLDIWVFRILNKSLSSPGSDQIFDENSPASSKSDIMNTCVGPTVCSDCVCVASLLASINIVVCIFYNKYLTVWAAHAL